jgi:hypothetical protein
MNQRLMNQPTPERTPEPTPEPTPKPTPEPSPEPTPEPTPEYVTFCASSTSNIQHPTSGVFFRKKDPQWCTRHFLRHINIRGIFQKKDPQWRMCMVQKKSPGLSPLESLSVCGPLGH